MIYHIEIRVHRYRLEFFSHHLADPYQIQKANIAAAAQRYSFAFKLQRIYGRFHQPAGDQCRKYAGNHQCQHDPVIFGHLKNYQDRCNSRVSSSGHDSRHAHQRISSGMRRHTGKQGVYNNSEKSARHRPHKKRGRKNTARIAGAKSKVCRQYFQADQGQHCIP